VRLAAAGATGKQQQAQAESNEARRTPKRLQIVEGRGKAKIRSFYTTQAKGKDGKERKANLFLPAEM
jgi:hypothetical protein